MNKLLLVGLFVVSIIVVVVVYVMMSGSKTPQAEVEEQPQLLQQNQEVEEETETPQEEEELEEPTVPVPVPAPVPAPTPSPPAPAQLPANISKVFGWSGNHENPGDKNQTAEDCRQKALNSGGKYVAWGHRNSNHPDPNWRDTCFLYTQGFAPYAGNPADTVHQTGCLRPGEKVEWGCKTSECKLQCSNIINKFQDFYNTKGEWKGVFTMQPIRTNNVSPTECDVLYNYIPVPGGGRGDTGQDKRRFSLQMVNPCDWNVTGMGGYQSGTTM